MSPSDLRALMATAERQPGETTEQYNARHDAEHRLSSWRVWLPGLLATGNDIAELSDRLERWCANTGFDGNPDCPPMRAIVALRSFLPITPASQADGGAPAAIRSLPAGAHSSEVSQ